MTFVLVSRASVLIVSHKEPATRPVKYPLPSPCDPEVILSLNSGDCYLGGICLLDFGGHFSSVVWAVHALPQPQDLLLQLGFFACQLGDFLLGINQALTGGVERLQRINPTVIES